MSHASARRPRGAAGGNDEKGQGCDEDDDNNDQAIDEGGEGSGEDDGNWLDPIIDYLLK